MTRTYQAPPECICIGVKVVILTLLGQVHQKRGQDEAEEANVPGSHQLLQTQETVSLSRSGRPGQCQAWEPCPELCVHHKGFRGWDPLKAQLE